MKQEFANVYCNGQITYADDYNVQIDGKINDTIFSNTLHFIAPAPSKHNASFSGSGLPYFNKSQAYDNTPNKGSVKVSSDGEFSIRIIQPNSYYEPFDILNVPEIQIIYNETKTFTLKLKDERIPYRTLSYPDSRRNVLFYYNKNLPVRTQEKILLDSGYNQPVPDTFWGLKPPM